MTIRVLLTDDHKILRETLRFAVDLEDDMRVVGEAGSGAELFARLQVEDVDVVVLDIGLPDMSGVQVAQILAKEHPAIRVVMLSGYTDRIFIEEVLKAGASGFVVKSAGADELILAIRTAQAGKVFLSPEIASSLLGRRTDPEQGGAPPVSVLGKREREVLRLLAEGRSSPEIGAELGISPATVDVHRRNIKQKLGLNSIADMTRYAIREGLVAVK